MNKLELIHGAISLPAFLPDATLGVVRSVDADDLRRAGVQAVVMNVFHLMQRPGSSTIQALGGLHAMAAWDRPIVTDSGGFQAYSFIHQNPKFGKLTDRGITFQPENSNRKFQLTPEKCIQLQMAYGADIVICLDDCTHVDASYEEQRQAVERTIQWARRCKAEYERQLEIRKPKRGIVQSERHPLIFGVVQGGDYRELRRRCADALLEIGFDGFGYGGWPLDQQGELLYETIRYTRSLIPPELPMHALGIGQPGNVVASYRMGYEIFDSALPTRDARDGRLYAFRSDPTGPGFELRGEWYSYLYIQDKKHIKAATPISPGCDCYTCSTYTLGYLHHLFKIGDTLFFRLATIHNVRCTMQLMDLLRAGKHEESSSTAD